MATKLLCATDGSDHSERAVAFAVELAKRLGASLSFLTVNPLSFAFAGRGPTTPQWTEEQAQEIVGRAVSAARAAGLANASGSVMAGAEAAAAIVEHAETNGFDQIVVGTGGKTGVKRLVLGSVAADVVAKAHCPVTVVR